MIHDDRPCELGEGPLWHPERNQLFWFDILSQRLLTRTAEGPLAWAFPHRVSAAGWVDRDRLLIARKWRCRCLTWQRAGHARGVA